jgi:hypothetical protein
MLDDDCDGYTDNAVGLGNNTLQTTCDVLCAGTGTCRENVGRCKPGNETCSSGAWGACVGEIGPTAETCNNLDDNCDGYTDNAAGSNTPYSLTQSCDSACVSWNTAGHGTTCRGFPFGRCAAGTQTCSGSWGSCTNETGPTAEVCNNVDDDCDGYTDDAPGHGNNSLQQTVHPDCDSWTGSGKNTCIPATGQCRSASETCTSGNWGTTIAERGPSTELCNNLDDDCDGVTDNKVGSTTGYSLTFTCDSICAGTAGCVQSAGQCHNGTSTCSSGGWGSCAGEIGPTAELCNNLDDNCDGYTDNAPGMGNNSLSQSCGSACTSWNANTATHPADPETACQQGVGQCSNGVQSCSGGLWGTSCVGETGPSVELCNGLDDDCDGFTDNNPNDFASNTLQRKMDPLCMAWTGTGKNTCQAGVGQCRSAVQTCSAPETWSATSSEIGPSTELCNGLDDDCDGFTDNTVGTSANGTLSATCDSMCAATSGCIADTGQCQSGSEACAIGTWGSCMNEIGPTAEVCNGLDDNCDGYTDNAPGGGNNSLTQPCSSACTSWDSDAGMHPGDPETNCRPGVGQCRNGTQSCSGTWGACAGETGPTAEVCNGLDDDCDGYTDNEAGDFQSYTLLTPCDWECSAWTGAGKNTCVAETGQCRGGTVSCTATVSSVIASSQGSPYFITTDAAGSVYWVDESGGEVVQQRSDFDLGEQPERAGRNRCRQRWKCLLDGQWIRARDGGDSRRDHQHTVVRGSESHLHHGGSIRKRVLDGSIERPGDRRNGGNRHDNLQRRNGALPDHG